MYIAYVGGLNILGTKYVAADGRKDQPDTTKLFVVSSSTDTAGYNRVLEWLQKKGNG